MIRLAKELPEFETVYAMYGIGETNAAQLMAEIGDIRNYPCRSALVGFAGIDPEVNQSGKMNSQSNPSTKRGSPHLRRTMFQIWRSIYGSNLLMRLCTSSWTRNDPKASPTNVYMTAGSNKFLRIYYARVKECMAKLDTPAENSEMATD